MKIEQPLEINGMRLLITIESKDLITHSKMQKLEKAHIEDIKKYLRYVLEQLVNNRLYTVE